MADTQLRELARLGAQARLQQLEEERTALLQMFPEFKTRSKGKPSSNGSAPEAPSPTRKRRKMSAAARRAVGERMKAYWAAKRAEKATAGEGAQVETGTASHKSGRTAARKQGRKR